MSGRTWSREVHDERCWGTNPGGGEAHADSKGAPFSSPLSLSLSPQGHPFCQELGLTCPITCHTLTSARLASGTEQLLLDVCSEGLTRCEPYMKRGMGGPVLTYMEDPVYSHRCCLLWQVSSPSLAVTRERRALQRQPRAGHSGHRRANRCKKRTSRGSTT